MYAETRRIAHALLGLSARDALELCQAQLYLVRAQFVVWTRPQGRLVGAARGTAEGNGSCDAADAADVTNTARRLGAAVRRAADYGIFRPQCLVRSLALVRLLERHGVRGARLRLGVQRAGGRFVAHAWVDYGGAILADPPDAVRRLHPLGEVSVIRTSAGTPPVGS